jgi:endo-1,4-beta-xylanase
VDVTQANTTQYAGLTQACMNVSRCIGITVWGVRDCDSWRSGESPLLFDCSGNKKAAYTSVLNVLNSVGNNNPTPTRTPTLAAGQPTPTRTPTPGSGGTTYYRVVGRNSGKALDICSASTADGACLQQYSYGGGTNQQFEFRAVSGTSYFQIIARHSGKCLDVPNSSTANAVLLQQWTCNGGANQQFSLQTSGSFIRIINRNSGKCLDVPNSSTADGTRIQQYTCSGGANQDWTRSAP